ncbi:HEAT repeat domain-containing protein [Phytomonospora sp. NPDC050363]|uniref:HEAT repeat domain-containing protein n=1 Tax=Phytomonospora sp. NPDC050363 TaxID=3155642 RepID=UPI003404EBB2
MTDESHRLVLKDHAGFAALAECAETHGWTSLGMLERDPGQRVYRELAWSAGDDMTVHYVEDEFVDERFVFAKGGTAEARETALSGVAGTVAVWSLDDLMYEVSAAAYPAGRARAVMRLGVGSPARAVEGVLTRIERASRDADPRVRKCAVWAMGYADWPEYGPVLDRVAGDDVDPGIAHSASLVRQGLGLS